MTDVLGPAVAPGPFGDAGARPGRRLSRALRRARELAGIAPFAVYVLLGLGLPIADIARLAFQDPNTGKLTLANIHIATHGIYLHSFAISFELSLIASIVPAIAGFLLAYAIHTARRGALLRRVAVTASGVFAWFGGVPLAFLFIATLGTTGIATGWLTDLGFNPWNHGFNLY